MRRIVLLSVALVLLCCGAIAAQAAPVAPYESAEWSVSEAGIDTRVQAALEQKGLRPARPCSDEVFVRRVYIDLIGTVPRPAEVQAFLQDDRPDRRARLIDSLMEREEFADYWAMKWCDLLRVKAEFPVNLWPNGVQCYHRWIWESMRDNRPYDEFARALLTSSGSNFRVPPINFYRATQSSEPPGLAAAVALTFMGTRFGQWPEERREGMAAFFSRVAFKPTREWKEEIVLCDPTATDPLTATFPDGETVTIPPDTDPRVVFADWLISADNPWFARAMANRAWCWLFGRGIVHEADDIRPDNPPVNPELLNYLEEQFVASDWDLRELFRLICNSRTYQQSPIPRTDHPDAEKMFACYPVHRMEAEVLLDALNWIGGSGRVYQSPIPEPFTWVPEYKRAIQLSDGSITSNFLQMFGRPSRDTGLLSERNNKTTDQQRLFMLNSTDVYNRIADSVVLKRVVIEADGDREKVIRGIYLTLLSREPTADELAAGQQHWQAPEISSREAAIDLAWALVNSMEFLYRH